MERTIRQSLDSCLLQIVDGGLAGVIFLVPLLMGGRHALGQLVLTALSVTVAVAWASRQSLRKDAAWRPTWATPLIFAGLAIVGLQLIPLPPWLLAMLSPHTSDILPAWGEGAATAALLGHWTCLSFTPSETLAGLVIFLDFALLFFVVAQRTERIDDVERLLRWCALSAVGMALFGIVQLVAGNGKFFWFYEHPFACASDVAKGSFSNRNHFTQFLALGTGPLIWWLQDSLHRVRPPAGASGRRCETVRGNAELTTYFLGLALGIVLFAGLLSLSRGGIAAMLLAVAICTAVYYRAALVGRRFVATLAVAGLLIGVSLVVFGYDRVSNRLEDFSAGSLERLDQLAGRRTVWAAAARALPDGLAFGSGVGSFHAVAPRYIDTWMEDTEYTHAENCYLQIAVETGVAGLALALAGVVLCLSWCIGGIRSSVAARLRVCAAALAGSLAASAVHATVDFVWYVPGCMAMAAILAACALRVRQLHGEGRQTKSEPWAADSGQRKRSGICVSSPIARSSSSPSRPSSRAPRLPWPTVAAGLALVGGWMIVNGTGPALAQLDWDEYLLARGTVRQATLETSSAEQESLWLWLADLEDVVRWQPTHRSAHLALAETHRRLFDALQKSGDNPMSLADIREAAIASHFASREALVNWLSRAVGTPREHLERALYHTRKALAISPLQGRAYVYLAELSFLVGGDHAVARDCIEQALRVRPFDGDVLFAAANEALRAGDTERWVDYAKRAFRCGRRIQQQILSGLVAGLPAEGLPAMLDFVLGDLQPDLGSLRYLHGECAKRFRPEQLIALRQSWAQKAEAEAASRPAVEAAPIWLEAQQLYSGLGENDAALKCARNGVECDPGNFANHYQLALCLLHGQLFAEAELHLRWCLQRMPDNPAVESKLREALKGRIESQHRTAADRERSMAR
jgi:O-antigen ligase/tetratricopeptide (TPR) repeat protein